MKYYIIAGEASGDLHASNLVKALNEKDANATFRGWGGDLMQAEGVQLVKHYKDTAYMGFLTVAMHLPAIARNIKQCKEDILRYEPDVLILVDYAGFNLRIAKFAKRHNLKVCYYIAPKVWAWKESRIKKLRRYVDYLYCILPFEEDYFRSHGIKTFYAGNPLLDAIASRPNKDETKGEFRDTFGLDKREIIALLPGSRKQEIDAMLPKMLQASKSFTNYQFILAGAPGLTDDFYEKYVKSYQVKIVRDVTYRLLSQSKGALVASGTATLETALLNVPQVVCYNAKGGKIAYAFGKWLIQTDYISLVNLILQKEAVKELIITYFTTENLIKELRKVLEGKERIKILEDYKILHEKMGKPGVSKRCATQLLKDIKK
ncbi:lipid-A-disaccharide synthase [Balneicella halophila]|uniref:Lipid-A-disaccharide synthase n=1 Tax=Balneicella halophila TaxID=1537566 RepID=A0A7L4USE9_BALHA|nr:lipid-A-disaccharide synthase [Balneicella halophila]PVX52619.1 lipid-A-disaccharide synthase [Balneicella halophila]